MTEALIRQEVAQDWTFEMVRVDLLKIDATYHDPSRFNERRANAMGDRFDLSKVGVIEVSRRANGLLITLDGNHRVASARRAGVEYLPAKVHHGLNVEREAAIYLGVNDAVRLSALHEYRAALITRDPQAVAIDASLRLRGIKVTSGGLGSRRTKSVTTLVRLHQSDVLDETLRIVDEAWRDDPRAFDAVPLQGVASFVKVYQDHPRYDATRLSTKLQEESAAALVRRSKDLASLEGRFGTGGNAGRGGPRGVLGFTSARRAVLGRYNHRLVKPLPDASLSDLGNLARGKNPWVTEA